MSAFFFRQRRKSLFQILKTRKSQSGTLAASSSPVNEIKPFSLTYPEFCLLIEVVGALAGSKLDIRGDWTRIYERLGGRA